ncbi:TolC family outer membrane protein [Rhodoferax sp. OV413]|uniref:TolC family outer membrane protein n=1 Tax=Rhodoferax sp. OV413 TaxID=1855285 RepID=UPI0025EF6515|nr:TolC family outer membrane protein [Rhodoferax sp. OV413]
MHRQSSPLLRLLPLALALAGAFSASGAAAQSLQDLYTAARGFDASYQSAKSQFDATVAKAEQARALLLPTANLALGASNTSQDITSGATNRNFSFDSQNVTVSASHPLYRPVNKAGYEQGMKQFELARAQLLAAEQDLIVKVGQAYFDVLASADSLAFVKAQKTAVAEQLASAKRNFEVGTSTITDTREAQARFDLVVAQELAAENDLRVKNIALNQLVGLPNAVPKSLAVPVVLAPLTPADPESWVQQSASLHPALVQLQIALDVAKLETEKAEAANKPTVDLTGSYTLGNSQRGTSTGPTSSDTRSNVAVVGVSFNYPLFNGYSVQNRIKETLALEDKARTDLEASRRTIAQGVRTAFFGVLSGQAQVKAFEAAEESSQSALDANKLGYQVGVRINIDVLNSQSQLYDTKAKLAKARYDVLLGGLKLKQAAGILKAEDLAPVNSQLAN